MADNALTVMEKARALIAEKEALDRDLLSLEAQANTVLARISELVGRPVEDLETLEKIVARLDERIEAESSTLGGVLASLDTTLTEQEAI
jgi:uncharacterized protein YyaL (SSP411 family)